MSAMVSLDNYLFSVRRSGAGFAEGLEQAKRYVLESGGSVSDTDTVGVTKLSLRNDVAYCFQPYQDINKFYFEI